MEIKDYSDILLRRRISWEVLVISLILFLMFFVYSYFESRVEFYYVLVVSRQIEKFLF